MCLQTKSLGNAVGKGETACKKQFLLFPMFSTCFGELTAIFIELKKCVILKRDEY